MKKIFYIALIISVLIISSCDTKTPDDDKGTDYKAVLTGSMWHNDGVDFCLTNATNSNKFLMVFLADNNYYIGNLGGVKAASSGALNDICPNNNADALALVKAAAGVTTTVVKNSANIGGTIGTYTVTGNKAILTGTTPAGAGVLGIATTELTVEANTTSAIAAAAVGSKLTIVKSTP